MQPSIYDCPIFELSLITMDLESTGLNPNSARICQVALVEAYNRTITREKCIFINPGITIPLDAQRVHGISNFTVRNAPYFRDIAGYLHQLVNNPNLILAGHNLIQYDWKLLGSELERAFGFTLGCTPIMLDTLVLSKSISSLPHFNYRPQNHKLSTLASYFNLKVAKAHDALSDARTSWSVLDKFVELLEHKQQNPVLLGDLIRLQQPKISKRI